MIGIKDQVALGASSFEEARERHQWTLPETYNLAADCVSRWAADPTSRDRNALIDVGVDGEVRRTTWGDLDRLVARFAHALEQRVGLRPGDVCAVMAGQRLETAVAHMAIYRLGAVALPIAKILGADGVAYRLQHSGAVAAVVDEPSRRVVKAIRDLPQLRSLVVIEDPTPSDADGSFWSLIKAAAEDAPIAETGPRTPAVLIYTSGTTGEPKGCLHGHRVGLAHANLSYLVGYFREDDVYYSTADWAWVAGLFNGLLAPWGHGVTVVAHDGRFDPERFLQICRDHRVSTSLLPPTVLRLIRRSGAPIEHRLRAICSGGELVTPELSTWCTEHLVDVINVGYGQSEINDVIGEVAMWEQPDVTSLGKPLPGHDVALMNDDGSLIDDDDVVGEIVVRHDPGNPAPMLEYYREPEATAAKFRDGWVHTGDLGRRSSDGYLHFEGRQDDIIKASGYRLSPSEIETAVLADPAVAECAALGAPDPERGEVVALFVRLQRGSEPDDALADRLRQAVRDRVGKHATPRVVRFVGDLPRTVTGKIRRVDLRSSLQAGPSDTADGGR